MATLKIWKVSSHLERVLDYDTNEVKTRSKPDDFSGLYRVLDYDKDETKTNDEMYVAGINCIPEKAAEQFIAIKKTYGKLTGIPAYHGYLSFKGNECTPEEALMIGKEFVSRTWGDRFQAVVSVHLNTENTHCHFCLNSVSFVDGKKIVNNEKNWDYLRHKADEVCQEFGKSIIDIKASRDMQPPEDLKDISDSNVENPRERSTPRKKRPTSRDYKAKSILDNAIKKSKNLDELEKLLEINNVEFQFNDAYKYWTIKAPYWEKPYRTERLDKVFDTTGYSKDEILERLEKNRTRASKKQYSKSENKAKDDKSDPEDIYEEDFTFVCFTQKNDFYTRGQKQGIYIERTYNRLATISFRRLFSFDGTNFLFPIKRYHTFVNVKVLPARPKRMDKKTASELRQLQNKCHLIVKHGIHTEEDFTRSIQTVEAQKKVLTNKIETLSAKQRGPEEEKELKEARKLRYAVEEEEKTLKDMQLELELDKKIENDKSYNNKDRSDRSR